MGRTINATVRDRQFCLSSYGRPDPKDLLWPILGNGEAVLVFLLAPIGFVISLIVAFHPWYSGRRD